MSEQQTTAPVGASTGATDAQIEAAAMIASSYAAGIDWDDDRHVDGWVSDLSSDMTRTLVPPGYVIVPAASLPSAEVREAVRAAIEYIEAVKDFSDEMSTMDEYQRLKAAGSPDAIVAMLAVFVGEGGR
jgi:hypothetical protein